MNAVDCPLPGNVRSPVAPGQKGHCCSKASFVRGGPAFFPRGEVAAVFRRCIAEASKDPPIPAPPPSQATKHSSDESRPHRPRPSLACHPSYCTHRTPNFLFSRAKKRLTYLLVVMQMRLLLPTMLPVFCAFLFLCKACMS